MELDNSNYQVTAIVPSIMLLNTVALLLGVELTNKNEEYCYGYNFTFNTTYTGLNTSILTFNLNHSESVFIECANGDEIDKMNTTVTDLG